MKPRHVADLVGAAAVATLAIQSAPTPPAHAVTCPDAEVVFARGTTEPPGLGGTGEAFVNSLRSQLGAKSLGVYAVNYPATTDFPTAVDGITDARKHVISTVANCPRTKVVLGGFSQGAAVMGFVTANAIPDGVSGLDVPAPMPPEVASNVAAVALFGKPSTRFMRVINQPDVTIGPQYAAKSIDLCVDNDLICADGGRDFFTAHNQYIELGMTDQAAAFVANKLKASWASDGRSPAAPPPARPAPPPPVAPPSPAPVASPAPAAPAPVASPAPAAPPPAPPTRPAPPPPAAPPPQPPARPAPPAPPPAAPGSPAGPLRPVTDYLPPPAPDQT